MQVGFFNMTVGKTIYNKKPLEYTKYCAKSSVHRDLCIHNIKYVITAAKNKTMDNNRRHQ